MTVEGKGDGAALVPTALIGGLLVGFQDGAATAPTQAAATESPKAEKPAAPPAKKEAGEGAREPSPEYLDPIIYGVAAVDGAFFVRSGSVLYRIGKP